MSYVDLSPEVTFHKLDRILRSQKRMMFMNVAVATGLAGVFLVSLVSVL